MQWFLDRTFKVLPVVCPKPGVFSNGLDAYSLLLCTVHDKHHRDGQRPRYCCSHSSNERPGTGVTFCVAATCSGFGRLHYQDSEWLFHIEHTKAETAEHAQDDTACSLEPWSSR